MATLALIALNGCDHITPLANDQYEECRQCTPPEIEDRAIGEYQLCQAYRLDKCRVLLGHKPEFDWSEYK